MKQIKFLRNYTVSAVDGRSYREGEVCRLTPESADHFISRGVAIEHVEKPKRVVEPQSVPSPKVDQPQKAAAPKAE